jgi:hypothetical protein
MSLLPRWLRFRGTRLNYAVFCVENSARAWPVTLKAEQQYQLPSGTLLASQCQACNALKCGNAISWSIVMHAFA